MSRQVPTAEGLRDEEHSDGARVTLRSSSHRPSVDDYLRYLWLDGSHAVFAFKASAVDSMRQSASWERCSRPIPLEDEADVEPDENCPRCNREEFVEHIGFQ